MDVLKVFYNASTVAFLLIISISCSDDPTPTSSNSPALSVVDIDNQTLVSPTNSTVVTPTINYSGSGSLSYQWTVTSTNSADATISNATENSTSISFANLGIYTILFSVTDGSLIDTDTFVVTASASGSSGIVSRPSNTTCLAPDLPPPSSTEIQIVPAFPSLPALNSGDLPIALKQPPGDDTLWMLITQDGLVYSFDNSPTANSFNNILTISVDRSSGELGLLGFAFHPDFASNNYIYFSYNILDNGRNSRITRYTYNPTSGLIDPASATQILNILQPNSNHNGGTIEFGPDGMLYFGLGDGGGGGDPDNNGQDLTTALGSMLRIDVDSGSPYSIPADNPYVGNASGYDERIFAHGFRNPWKWSFDKQTGDLWLGDVGQGAREEINIVTNGENYGWNLMEGSLCFSLADYNAGIGNGSYSCTPPAGLTLPVYEHPRSDGQSIVGGYVYRGSAIPALVGTYIYTDYYPNPIRSLVPNGSDYVFSELLNSNGGYTPSFAEDNSGEIYLLRVTSTAGENIWKITPVGATGGVIPTQLSETGCVDSNDPFLPAPGMIPFDVNAPLWSDNAEKYRFLSIPDGTTIDLDAVTGDFIFPTGSVLMKHFLLNDRIFETRLLMRHQTGWGGYSYEWQYDTNNDPVDATLLTEGKDKTFEGVNWHYPSRTECFLCHTEAANFTLGPEVSQLNKEQVYPTTFITANQIDTLDTINMFTSLEPALNSLFLYALDDETATVEQRARSYLHTNCGVCHRPGGGGRGTMDLRYSTSFQNTQTCGTTPSFGSFGITNAQLIAPGSPDQSVLYHRLTSTDSSRMPPLGTGLVDNQAASVINEWITGLADCN